jgi:hypothetical protein
VVGLPGEKVTFDAGRVSIDGRHLREPYASPSVFRGQDDVPVGHFLVLGDNRDVSSDSRSWSDAERGHTRTAAAALTATPHGGDRDHHAEPRSSLNQGPRSGACP